MARTLKGKQIDRIMAAQVSQPDETKPRTYAEQLRRASAVGMTTLARAAVAAEDSAREREITNAGYRMCQEPAKLSPSILIHEHKPGVALESPSDDSTKRTVETRVDHYAKCHERTLDMASHLESLLLETHAMGRKVDDIAHDMRRCGKVLHFHEYPSIEESRLYAGKFCQQWKLCPLCATRRSARMIRAYAPKIVSGAIEKNLVPYLLTLTVRNGEHLEERFEHLVACWQKLQARRRDRQKYERGTRRTKEAWTELARAESIAYSYELKRGRDSGLWHPHLHAMLLCDREPDPNAIAQEWHAITGDSFIVDVRPFHCVDALKSTDPDDIADLLAGDLVELLKYALKFSDLSLADNWEAAKYLAGRRLIGSIGPSLRGVTLPTSYLDAPLEVDDLPFIEAVATYTNGAYDIQRSDLTPSVEPTEAVGRSVTASPSKARIATSDQVHRSDAGVGVELPF